MIHLCTSQHTGTWFLIRMLQKHPEVHDYVILWMANNKTEITKIDDSKQTIFHCHTPAKDDFYFPMTDSLVQTHKMVLTLRDPILSLTTRQTRHPELDHTYILESFLQMAEWKKRNPDNLFFFNIHNQTDAQVRALFSFLGLSTEPDIVKTCINGWEPENTTRDKNVLRQAYAANGVEALREEMPEEMAFFDEHKEELQQFLEPFMELPWYS